MQNWPNRVEMGIAFLWGNGFGRGIGLETGCAAFYEWYCDRPCQIMLGVKYMDFEGFDPKKIDQYCQQAKVLYGKTDAYKEFEQKQKDRTEEQEKDLGAQVMELFANLGKMRPCAPDSEAAQNWAKELQAFFTEHFYTCTPQILGSLAESYAGGGSMTENIDKVGGDGTGAFAKQVIDIYVARL